MRFILQHVSIPRPSGDENARLTRHFYHTAVGLPEKPVPDSIVHHDLIWFIIGEGTELHVFTEENTDMTSGRHFCLQVETVEAMRQQLTESGYLPYSVDEIRGRPRFFCRDPFGNIVEFTQITGDYLQHQS